MHANKPPSAHVQNRPRMSKHDYQALMFCSADEPTALKLATAMGLRVWQVRGRCVGITSGHTIPRIVSTHGYGGLVDFERSSALVGDYLSDGGLVVWVARRRAKTEDGMGIHEYVLIATNP